VGWGIAQPEYEARVARVRRELERRHLTGLVLCHPIRMAHLSGFFHYSTERPMAIVVGQDGSLAALVPHLAADGVKTLPARDSVDRLRAVKSEAELAFIKESCVWETWPTA
jgi:Xaa-Pro aminopeptidase